MTINGMTRKQTVRYRIDSDISFQKFAKEIGNDYCCYFELVKEGIYKLIPKRNVI